VEDILFDPWGQVWQSWGSGGYSFAQLPYYDTTTNTSITMLRHYSPNLGRWLSPDPMGGDLTNPQSLNRYPYVLNNPTTLTDRLGLWPTGSQPICEASPARLHGVHAMYGGGGGCFVGGGGGGVSIDGGPPLPFGTSGGGSFGGGGDSAIPCPGGVCEYINEWGQLVQFTPFADGTYGYYAVWGPGGIYETAEQAAIASSQWGISYLQRTQNEIGGSLWCGGDFCSSSIQGGTTGWSFQMDFGFGDIPEGTNPEGWWRAQNGESPSSDLANVDYADSQLGTSFPLYTGTTSGGGRVLLYDPAAQGPYECVLVGGPWIWGSAQPCH
jgi:RHS repeat-associated protein